MQDIQVYLLNYKNLSIKFQLPIDKQNFLCYNNKQIRREVMENAVILDFMGVIADFDFWKLISETPFKEKLSSGRLVARLATTKGLKKIFESYKLGEINQDQLARLLVGKDKKLNTLVHSVFERIPEYITPNQAVIQRIKELKDSGSKIVVLSNTIPETECVIKKLKLAEICDDVICSTEVGMIKPNQDIFSYAIEKNKLNPLQTVYIDDSKKNLLTAEKLGIQTFHVSDSEEAVSLLDDYMFYVEYLNDFGRENVIYF